MEENYNYDDIRPYRNDEVKEKIQLLLNDPVFDRVLLVLFKTPETVAVVKQNLSAVRTIKQLQESFIVDLLEMVLKTSSDGLTVSGLNNLKKNKSYLFISNHRDIILDSALLNYLLVQNGMNATQIAIGSNLLILDWITHAVKLNRSFIVKRDIAVRELLEASQKVSSFIRDSITINNKSVWLAQREGRTKDGNDKTQLSLLKMLNMSNSNNFAEGFSELNIVPVSISYEIEPCGVSKIKELIKKEQNEYKKRSKDDMKSMARGMQNNKGRIHFSFAEPITAEINKLDITQRANDLIPLAANLIDNHIHSEFKLWPNNYVAMDMLAGNKKYKKHYNQEQKAAFELLLIEAQANIGGDEQTVTDMFLKLYANPVLNAEAVKVKALECVSEL